MPFLDSSPTVNPLISDPSGDFLYIDSIASAAITSLKVIAASDDEWLIIEADDDE